MAFKRYIHKHGKKLGPYYYENVRGHDGGVKTVYLGTNPEHHPKHRIKKPLFFLILVLVLVLIFGGLLFLLQNKSYLIKKVKAQEPDFDVDQILLKVLIKSNEFIEKQARIMSTGKEPATINVDILGLSDIVKADSASFTIKPGQTKVLNMNFSSYMPEQRIEQQPGIYVGKLVISSQKAVKEIPMVAEIETRNVLFDMNLNPVALERRVKQGTDTTIEVRLFNLQSIESANVDVDYFVKDINGNTIVTESETVVAKSQASFFKTISIPKNLKPGPYVFAAEARFGNSVGTSSYMFEVIGPEPESSFVEFCKNSLLCLGLSLTTMLLLFALTAYFYFFIGAYLYDKVTGWAAAPKRRKEKAAEKDEGEAIEEPEEGVLGKIKGNAVQWKAERKGKKAEKAEVIEEAEEIEEHKPGIFERIKAKLDAWKKEKEEARLEKQKQKREGELRQLENERKKALEKKISEPSARLKKFYKLIDEAHESLGKKDSSMIDGIYRKEAHLYSGLPLHEKREVYDKLAELHNQRNKFLELKKRHDGQIKEEESRKQKEIEMQKAGKERQEAIKKEEELRKQRELEEKRKADEEKLKIKQETKKREAPEEQGDVLGKAEEKKTSWLGKLLKKKEEAPESEKFKEKPEGGIVPEKKPGILKRLFRKEKREEETKEHEKQKPKSDVDELEEAIKNLGLFKELEKGKGIQKKKPGIFERLLIKKKEAAVPKEEKAETKASVFGGLPGKEAEKAKEKPEIKLSGRNMQFENCHKLLDEAKDAVAKKNFKNANKLYIEARNLYIGLSNHEKKELYGELMELYNELR